MLVSILLGEIIIKNNNFFLYLNTNFLDFPRRNQARANRRKLIFIEQV